MNLETALSKLNIFLSTVNETSGNYDDVSALLPDFNELKDIPKLFHDENLQQFNDLMVDICAAIEAKLIVLLNVFLDKLKTNSYTTDSMNHLAIEYQRLQAISTKFEGVSLNKIQPLLCDEVKRTLISIMLNLASKSSAPDKSRMSELNNIREDIHILRKKVRELKDKQKDTPASLAASKLCDDMESFASQYEKHEINRDTFKELANSVIAHAHIELDKPRGYCVKHILVNLAFAVLTLGVGYLAAAVYKGTFFPIKPNTDSANKVNILAESVVNMPMAG